MVAKAGLALSFVAFPCIGTRDAVLSTGCNKSGTCRRFTELIENRSINHNYTIDTVTTIGATITTITMLLLLILLPQEVRQLTLLQFLPLVVVVVVLVVVVIIVVVEAVLIQLVLQ